MKKISGIVLSASFLFLSFNCKVQTLSSHDKKEPSTFFKHIVDSGSSRGVTVEETVDGGYVLTGYSTGGTHGNEDLLVIKTSLKGESIWKKYIGGKGEDYGWAIRQTDGSGFIVVGYTTSFGNGGMDVYLIRLDSIGDTLWTKTYGGEGDEYGWDVRNTKDKGFIIAAQTNSAGNGAIDAYLIKTDKDGNEEWSKTYGGAMIDRIFSVQQTQDGGYISTGITYSFDSINSEDRDGYLLKTDSLGNEEWYKIIGANSYDVCHSISLTQDGGYFITGYGESFATSGNRDVYLIKTDAQGNTDWLKAYGGIGEERGIKGYQTKDGGYIAIGYTSSNRDMYLLRTNNSGDTLWTRSFGNPDDVDFGYTVRETIDNGFILLGHSNQLNDQMTHILLIKTDGEGFVND